MDARIIAQFALATLLPSVATYALARLERRFKPRYWTWQILCGIVFGAIAILGTEFGIATNDATMNVRDAAPIVASLFFGAPAGIIAGIIGGIERWFAALWGRGMFTRLACSLATCTSGLYAALFRKYIFENRKAGWPHAAAVGISAEVLHLLLIFVTNTQAPIHAFLVVKACTIPMIGCVGLSCALAAVASAFANGEPIVRDPQEKPSISQVLQSHLLVIVILGFLITAAFTQALQKSILQAKTQKLLSLALEDAQNDIYKTSDDNLLALANQAAAQIPNLAAATPEALERLVGELGVTDVHVVNEQGIIVASSDERYVGFDMASGEQSSEFLMLQPGGGAALLVQKFQPSSIDQNVWRKYAGVRIQDGFLQVGYDADLYLKDLDGRVNTSVDNRHVGQDGALLVVAQDGSLADTRADLNPTKEDVDALVQESLNHDEGAFFVCDFMGTPSYVSYRQVEGFKLFALESRAAAELERDLSVLIMAYMEVLVFSILFVATYLIVRSEVVQNIWEVNTTLDKITNGNLKTKVEVQDNAEFVSLSEGINTMVASLRQLIAAESERIDRELGYARTIQEGALPRAFPPFPELNKFDIYAEMRPAREVGGDFYDFFLIGDRSLGFLVADVSGKGIPASLFMMAAKAELSNFMTSGMSLADAVQTANWHLCQNNEAGTFVTVWAGILDYTTGELTYVNAGHNPPLLRHDNTWTWLRERSGIFLGAFDTTTYESFTITLEPGDELLLYTDGVTEAFSATDELYGSERLQKLVEEYEHQHPKQLVDTVRTDVTAWSHGVEQSDDITLLALEYGMPPQATGSITVTAELPQLETILGFVHGVLRERSCPLNTQNQLDVVIEELFVNVCSYAYEGDDKPGTLTLDYVYTANPNNITICLTDQGIPFDPLDHADPLAPSSIDSIKIGGLGIMMVKRMTDDLSYVRDGDKNVVAFTKSW